VRNVTGVQTCALPIFTEDAAVSHAAVKPWQTIVWNDPVNLMSYVTYVFQKVFGYSQEHSTKLMLDVHNKGRALVSSGTKEKVERSEERRVGKEGGRGE